ncbi:MAG: hypothetical protein WB689_21870, partial [Xanthobacteraceae bacterium]
MKQNNDNDNFDALKQKLLCGAFHGLPTNKEGVVELGENPLETILKTGGTTLTREECRTLWRILTGRLKFLPRGRKPADEQDRSIAWLAAVLCTRAIHADLVLGRPRRLHSDDGREGRSAQPVLFSVQAVPLAADEHLWLERHQHPRRHHAPLQVLGSERQAHRPAALWRSRSGRPAYLRVPPFQPGGDAVGWSPDNLRIDRFGLNADFIRKNRLTWIDNLKTGSGGDLTDPEHNDHDKDYVRDYIREFGARKVEANALVVKPEAGRKLCRDAILKYVPADAVEEFETKLASQQARAHREIVR